MFIEEGSEASQYHLKHVKLDILDQDSCNRMVGYNEVGANQFCAGGQHGQDSCQVTLGYLLNLKSQKQSSFMFCPIFLPIQDFIKNSNDNFLFFYQWSIDGKSEIKLEKMPPVGRSEIQNVE